MNREASEQACVVNIFKYFQSIFSMYVDFTLCFFLCVFCTFPCITCHMWKQSRLSETSVCFFLYKRTLTHLPLSADITLQWLIQHSRTKRSSWEQTRHQQNRPRPPQPFPLKTLLPFPPSLYNYLLTPNPYALIPRLYSAEVLRCSKVQ